jgi:hypothetical protein
MNGVRRRATTGMDDETFAHQRIAVPEKNF